MKPPEPPRPGDPGNDLAPLFGMVGSSDAMRELHARLRDVARFDGAVLVVGETGTGKELAARAIHAQSLASAARFVAVNCAALPRELVESELFGRRRGAYTGAADDAPGLVRAAASGTLLLDEITEMAPAVQAKLLRVLEEGCVRPVGAVDEVPVRVRIVATTNRDPEEQVRRGRLRQDLLYRLDVHRIEVPPLRDRDGDVPRLLAHFLARAADRHACRVRSVSAVALAALETYPWPGNVRELAGAVESACARLRGGTLELSDLPPRVADAVRPAPGAAALLTSGSLPRRVQTFAEAERALVARALEATRGNKAEAARRLGISRKRLYSRLRRYRSEDPEEPGAATPRPAARSSARPAPRKGVA